MSDTPTFTYVRAAWECPRCHRINAPHVDKCDCVEKPERMEWPIPSIIYPYWYVEPTPYYRDPGHYVITTTDTVTVGYEYKKVQGKQP